MTSGVPALTGRLSARPAALLSALGPEAADYTRDGAAAPGRDMGPAWPALAAAAAALQHGRVGVAPGRVTINGVGDGDAAARAAAALEALGWAVTLDLFSPVAEAPPAEIELADAASEAEAPASSASPPPPGDYRLRAVHDGAGALRLSGDAPDARAARSLAAYARAAFTGVRLDLDLAPAAAPPPAGWRAAALSALSALSALKSGEARLEIGAVTLTGRAVDAASLRAAHRRLTEGLGEGWTGESRIALSPAEAAAAQPLPVGRCAARLGEIVAAQGLNFEPSSVRLDAASGGAVDKLVAVLKRCAGGRIEIAGHTDSQGREITNLALSRARAETVLDLLLAAGAPPGLLSAQGYGEAEPVASNATEEGRARNRRIEFRVLEGDR